MNIKFFQQKSSVVIEFIGKDIRIARTTRKGNKKNVYFSIVPSEIYENKKTEENCVLIIPRSLVAIRIAEFPSTDITEINKMVDFYVKKEIPYAKDESIVSYNLIETNAHDFSKVMIAVVHRDIINNYLLMLEAIGFIPNAIVLNSQQIFKLYRLLTINRGADSFCVIDVDLFSTEVNIIKDKLIFTRSIPVGTTHLEEAISEKLKNSFIQEIKRSLDYYGKKQAKDKINKLLTNFKKLIPDLEKLTTFPVEYVNPLDLAKKNNIELSAEKHDILDSIGSFSKILGATIRYKKSEFNFLPEEYKQKLYISKLIKESIVIGILLSIIISFWVGIFIKKVHEKKKYISVLENEIGKIEVSAKKLIQMEKVVRNIQSNLYQDRVNILDLLAGVYASIQGEMSLSGFSYDSDTKTVIIQGSVPDMSDVFNFISRLEKTQIFINIDMKQATRRKEQNKEITDFQINCKTK